MALNVSISHLCEQKCVKFLGNARKAAKMIYKFREMLKFGLLDASSCYYILSRFQLFLGKNDVQIH